MCDHLKIAHIQQMDGELLDFWKNMMTKLNLM